MTTKKPRHLKAVGSDKKVHELIAQVNQQGVKTSLTEGAILRARELLASGRPTTALITLIEHNDNMVRRGYGECTYSPKPRRTTPTQDGPVPFSKHHHVRSTS